MVKTCKTEAMSRLASLMLRSLFMFMGKLAQFLAIVRVRRTAALPLTTQHVSLIRKIQVLGKVIKPGKEEIDGTTSIADGRQCPPGVQCTSLLR